MTIAQAYSWGVQMATLRHLLDGPVGIDTIALQILAKYGRAHCDAFRDGFNNNI